MKKTWIKVAAVLIVLALLAFVAYAVYDRLFPKAPKVAMPTNETIVTCTFMRNDIQEEIAVTGLDRMELMDYLRENEPTRKMSVNDHPDVTPYYIIEVTTLGESYRFYAYGADDNAFIEIPYIGIYRVPGSTVAKLFAMHAASSYS